MPREAKWFEAAKGSPTRGFLKLTGHANLPPNWIERARLSRKQRLEPAVVKALKALQQLQKKRPNAKVTIRAARVELRRALGDWEVAYRKECFYYGVRVLLELQREGETSY